MSDNADFPGIKSSIVGKETFDPTVSPVEADTRAKFETPYLQTPNAVIPGVSIRDNSGRVTNDRVTARELFSPMSNLIRNGGVDGVHKLYAKSILEGIGYDPQMIESDFDNIMASMIGETGQHVKMSNKQYQSRLDNFVQESFDSTNRSARVADALLSGVDPDERDIADFAKSDMRNITKLDELPLPKMVEKVIADAYNVAGNADEPEWKRAFASVVANVSGPIVKAEAMVAAFFNPADIATQTQVAMGQMGATLADPSVRNFTVGGAGAAALYSAASGPVAPAVVATGALAGYVGSSAGFNAKAEAGNMYLQLVTDQDMAGIPRKMIRDYSLLYGAISAGIETIPDAVLPETILPGITSSLKKAVRAGLVVGSSKDILKESLKKTFTEFERDAGKAVVTGAATEGLQQYAQNIVTNAMIDAAKNKAKADGVAYSHEDTLKYVDVMNGVIDSMWAGAQMELGMGITSGAVSGKLFSRMAKNKSISEAVDEKPVEPVPSNSDKIVTDRIETATQDGTKSFSEEPVVLHAITSNAMSDAGSVFMSTSPETTSMADNTGSVGVVTVNDVMDIVSKNFPDFVASDVKQVLSNPSQEFSQETKGWADENGFDLNTISKDIAPNIGAKRTNKDYADALREIGVDTKVSSQLSSFVLNKEKTKVMNIQDTPSQSLVDTARREGFGAIAWKTGSEWNATVFDTSAVSKVADNSEQQSRQNMDTGSVVPDGSIAAKVSEARAPKEATQQSVELAFRSIDADTFSSGRDAIFNKIKSMKIMNDADANTVASASALLTERSGFSAKVMADEIAFAVKSRTGKVAGSYTKFPLMMLSITKGDTSPGAFMHEFTHSFLDFAPTNIIDNISKAYGKDVKSWSKDDHEKFVSDAMDYYQGNLTKIQSMDKNGAIGLVIAFNKLKAMLKKALEYVGVRNSISPDVVEFFDRLFNGDLTNESISNEKVRDPSKLHYLGEFNGEHTFVRDSYPSKFSASITKEEIESAKSLGGIVTANDIDINTETIESLNMAQGKSMSLDEIHDAIKNGEYVPTSELVNYPNDKIASQEINANLQAEGIAWEFENLSDSDLVKRGYKPEDRAEYDKLIGGVGKKADKTFRKFVKDNAKEVIESIKEYVGEERSKKMGLDRTMSTMEQIESAGRSVSRRASQFRIAYWNSMRNKNPLFDVALREEARYQESQQAKFEAMNEEDYISDAEESDKTKSVKTLQAMVNNRDRKIRDLERDLSRQKAATGSKIKAYDAKSKADMKLRKELSSAIKKMKQEQVEIRNQIERLKTRSPGKVATSFANMIDFLARLGVDDIDRDSFTRNSFDFQELKSLVESDYRFSGIDIELVKSAVNTRVENLSLYQIKKLNEYKSILRSAGREEWEQSVKDQITDPSSAHKAAISQQAVELGKNASEFEVKAYLESQQRKDQIVAMVDATSPAIDWLNDHMPLNATHRERRAELVKIRKQTVYRFKKEADNIVEDRLKEIDQDARSISDVHERKAFKEKARFEFSQQFSKKEYVNDNMSRSMWRKADQEEIDSMLKDPVQAMKSGLAYGDATKAEISKGSLGMRFIAIAQGQLPPDQLLILLDGGKPNGAFYNLIYGLTRGTGTVLGYEQVYKEKLYAIIDEHNKLLKDMGRSAESYQDMILLDREAMKSGSHSTTVYNGSERSKAIKIGKTDESRYMAFSRQAVMEMYAATKSDSKFDAVIHGNNIKPEEMRQLILALNNEDKILSDWIISKYADTASDFQKAYELTTGKRFIYSDGDYSPINRDFGVYSEQYTPMGDPIDGTQHESGSRAGKPDTSRAKERKVISPDHQVPIKLALVSNFFNAIHDNLRYISGSTSFEVMRKSLEMDKGASKSAYREMLNRYIGEKNYKYLVDLVEELQGKQMPAGSDIFENKIIRWVSDNLPIAQLGFMLMNGILQVTGALVSAPSFRNPWLAIPRILGHIVKYGYDSLPVMRVVDGQMKLWSPESAGKALREAYSKSTFLRDRTIDNTLKELEQAKLVGFENRLDKWKSASMAIFRYVDSVTTAATWEARADDEKNFVQRQLKSDFESGKITESEYGMKLAEADIIARNAAVETISRSQPNSDALSTPKAFKGRNDLVKMLLPFMQGISKISSQMAIDLPRSARALVSKRYSGRYKISKAVAVNNVTSILIYTFLGSSLFFMAKNGRPPEDEDEMRYVLMDWLSGPFGLWGKLGATAVDTTQAAIDSGKGMQRAKYFTSRFEPLFISQTKKLNNAVSSASASWNRGDQMHGVADTMKAVGTASGFFAGPTNFMNHMVDGAVLSNEQDSVGAFIGGLTGMNVK